MLARRPSCPRYHLAGVALIASLIGCATPPAGKEWVHPTRSHSEMESHLSGCKTNTVLLWPFDWASKCMRRRGYELHEIGYRYPSQDASPSDGAAQKLIELKRLRDAGAISAEEYEEKRQKYLDEL